MTTDEHADDCRSRETYANGCEPEACDCARATDASEVHAELEAKLAEARAIAARSERELEELRTAALAVCNAWVVQGVAPSFHTAMQRRLRFEWPTLATAVQRLTEVGLEPKLTAILYRRDVLGEWQEPDMSPPLPISAEGFEPVRRPGPRHAKPMQPPPLGYPFRWMRS